MVGTVPPVLDDILSRQRPAGCKSGLGYLEEAKPKLTGRAKTGQQICFVRSSSEEPSTRKLAETEQMKVSFGVPKPKEVPRPKDSGVNRPKSFGTPKKTQPRPKDAGANRPTSFGKPKQSSRRPKDSGARSPKSFGTPKLIINLSVSLPEPKL
ncbi:hypothetical protein, partial [Serratia marcescens]|uniref:hypothetical protein n=1 Tax=Serratia marcescens TaxID=615 RepID=UPI0028129B79